MGWMVHSRNSRRARFSAAIQTSLKALGTGALVNGMVKKEYLYFPSKHSWHAVCRTFTAP
jgi:hypothetical protein